MKKTPHNNIQISPFEYHYKKANKEIEDGTIRRVAYNKGHLHGFLCGIVTMLPPLLVMLWKLYSQPPL